MKKIKKSKIILGTILSIALMLTLSNFSIVRADDDAWPTIGSTEENTSSNTSTGNSSGNTSTNSSLIDDDDPFSNLGAEDWSTPSLENTTSNNQTNNTSANATNNSTADASVVFNTSNSNNTTNSSRTTTSNSNSLAKTGIADSNGMIAVILVVCGIVAVYSFKKISDYKNM